MAWGNGFEIYVAQITHNKMGKVIHCLQVPGEGSHIDTWTKDGILEYRRRLAEHLVALDKAIEYHGAHIICVRTNH